MSAQNQTFKLMGPAIDRTDWFEVPVVFVAQVGAAFTNNMEITVILRTRGQPGPVGPQGPNRFDGIAGSGRQHRPAGCAGARSGRWHRSARAQG